MGRWLGGGRLSLLPHLQPDAAGREIRSDGDYVRRYVPELDGLEKRYIHRPFEAPEELLRKAGVRLGETYPRPVVDHAVARRRALAAYKATR